MSYAVIRMQKFQASSIRGIENHNERLKPSHTNLDIDYEKSHLNKDLAKDERTYYMRIKERIEGLNLSKAIRKDAVVACGFVCTSDKAYFEGLSQSEKDKFFQASHDFLKKRYGEQNVIASKVHYDETTPHLHFYFVPVTSDNRLSAKSIFTPKELRSLQDDYSKHVQDNGFNLQRGEYDSKRKHVKIEELKILTKLEEQQQKKNQLDVEEKNIGNREEILKQRKAYIELEKGKCLHEYDNLKQKNEKLNSNRILISNKEKEVATRKNNLSVEERKVTAWEQALTLKKTEIKSESENLEKKINPLRSEITKLTQELTSIQQTINTAKQEHNTLGRQINAYQNAIVALRKDFNRFNGLQDVLNETDSFWDVLENGNLRSRQDLIDFQTDIINIQTACIAKHGMDLLDSILGSLQMKNISHGNGWDVAEANAVLSKLIGPEAAERLRYRERDSFGR